MPRNQSFLKRLQHNPIFCVMVLLLAAAVYYYQVSADSFTAEVIHIIDGDTIDVMVVDQLIRIRLAEIDAPEKQQAYGEQAQKTLAKLIANKTVTVVKVDEDQYQRLIAIVKLDKLTVNREMVKQGMAWVYTSYNHDLTLPVLEAKARASKVGLWSQAKPVAPWLYRKQIQNKANLTSTE